MKCSCKATAQGLRHRAQGKNYKRKLILSLCPTPYALCLMPLLIEQSQFA